MISLSFTASRRSFLGAGAALMATRARADEPPAILVVGDSQAQGLAGGLQRLFRRGRAWRVIDRSKISTGLLPRSSYDWPVQVHALVAADRADVAVAMFGANDRPPVGARDSQLAAFEQTYGAHVAEIARTLNAACRVVVWVGHPIVRDEAYQEDMKLLNAIYERQATEAGALFVSLWDRFAKDGQYDAFGPGEDGETTRLRADDGVHLSPAGYTAAAKLVMEKVAAA